MNAVRPSCCAIGIDPGASGGVAAVCYWPDGRTTHATLPCDTREALAVRTAIKTLCPWKDSQVSIVVGIEKAQPFPGRGVKTLWSVARAYYTGLAVVTLRRMACIFVRSQDWQRGLGVSKRGRTVTGKSKNKQYDDHKKRLVAACERRWPRALDGLNKGQRSGCADALWIAWHVARTNFIGANDGEGQRQASRTRRRQKASG